jgi:hypothetical protein
MLWELTLDEIGNNINTNEQMSNYRAFFINQAKHFFEREKSKKQNIMEMNKMFMSENIDKFQNVHKQIQEKELQNKKQNNLKEFLTIEDLHSDRLNQFEQSLEHKQVEFKNMMSIPIPKLPNFKEDIKLEKINSTEMQNVIAKTMSERKFEMDNIKNLIKNNSNNSNNSNNKNEKNIEDGKPQYQYANQITPKFIKIGEEVELDSLQKKKQITWGKNQEYSNEVSLEIKEINKNKNTNPNTNKNFFSKFKKRVENNESNNIIDSTSIQNEEHNTIIEITEMKEKISSLEEKINELIALFKNKIEIDLKQNFTNKYKYKDI